MRHYARLAAALSAAGLAVTACGGSTNVLQGKSPQDIIKLASASVSSGSYRMALHGKVSIDTSGIQGLPPSAVGSMTSALKDMTIDGMGDVQSPQRMRMTMSLKPLSDKQMVVVLYDGKVYLSQDNGSTFADAGNLNLQGLPVSPEDMLGMLKDTGQVQDQGATVRNGTRVEKIHAVITNDYLNQVFSKLGNAGAGGSGPTAKEMQQLGQIFQQTMTLKDSSIDAYIRQSDGRMDSNDATINLSIDMGKFFAAIVQIMGGAGQLPPGAANQLPNVTGSMVVNESVTSTYSDYGSKITVTQPTVDPSAPLPSGGLFGA
jgi:hypothetical protein